MSKFFWAARIAGPLLYLPRILLWRPHLAVAVLWASSAGERTQSVRSTVGPAYMGGGWVARVKAVQQNIL
jgi:hypothetical protein